MAHEVALDAFHAKAIWANWALVTTETTNPFQPWHWKLQNANFFLKLETFKVVIWIKENGTITFLLLLLLLPKSFVLLRKAIGQFVFQIVSTILLVLPPTFHLVLRSREVNWPRFLISILSERILFSYNYKHKRSMHCKEGKKVSLSVLVRKNTIIQKYYKIQVRVLFIFMFSLA